MIKPYFIFILVPFLLKKEWKPVFYMIVLCAVLSFLPFIYEINHGYEAYEMWIKTLSAPIHAHNYSKPDNQCLLGLLTRFLDFKDPIFTILLISSWFFVGFLWVNFYKNQHVLSTLVFSTIPVILWIGPLSWIHTQMLLLPLMALVIKNPASKKLLTISWILLNGTPLLGRTVNILLQRLGIPMIGYLIFLFPSKKSFLKQINSRL